MLVLSKCLYAETHEKIWLYYHSKVWNGFRSGVSFARDVFLCKTHSGIIKSSTLLRPWGRICIYKWSACPGHITINIRPAPVQMCKWSKQIWKCSYLVIGHFLLDETTCSRWLKHNWEPIFITTMLISLNLNLALEYNLQLAGKIKVRKEIKKLNSICITGLF